MALVQSDIVLADGAIYQVESGDTINDAIVNSGGTLEVFSGGTAFSPAVNSGGFLNISSGGAATDVVENGGYIDVGDGADVTFVPNTINDLMLDRISATVHSGTTANNTTINSLGKLYASYGASADSTTLNSGGRMFVSSGGTANSTTVNSSGFLYVYSGGTANSTTIRLDAKVSVFSGGVTHDTVVNNGGTFIVSSGGTAMHILENGGYVEFKEGADVTFVSHTINNLTVNTRTGTTVHSGTTLCGLYILGAGTLIIHSGGKLTGKIVVSGGNLTLGKDAILDFDLTSVAPGAAALINDLSRINLSSAPVYTITANADQTEGIYTLAEGAFEFDRTITVVNTSGVDIGTLPVGETTDISGIDYALSLSEDGVLTLKVGETETPSPYTSDGVIVNRGIQTVGSGEEFHDAFICSSGGLTVLSGGILNGANVGLRGSLYISSGGTAINILENGGYVEFEDGAEVSFVPHTMENNYISSMNGSATVHSGTTACNNTISYCSIHVLSGSIATGNFGGTIIVSSGGIANNNSGGTIIVSSGGVANNNSGTIRIYSGGVANNTIANSEDGAMVMMGVYPGGTANGVFLNGSGTVLGGTANNIVFASNTQLAFVTVDLGGVVNGAVVNGDTRPYDRHHTLGILDGTANDTTVNSGGWLTVYGQANNAAINSGGNCVIDYKGTANNTTVHSGGTMYLGYDYGGGGTANGITIHNGGAVTGIGKLTGKMVFESGAVVQITTLDFDLAQAGAGTEALVNDLSIVQGKPLYTLAAGGVRTYGQYTLANGAAGFTGTVTVLSASGKSAGTLAAGETVTAGKTEYTLSLADDVLSVTVAAAADPVSEVAPQTQTWEPAGDDTKRFIVEYSTDDFEHVVRITVESNSLDTYRASSGDLQWHVKPEDGDEWTVGEPAAQEEPAEKPVFIRSDADGSADTFFVRSAGTWGYTYHAQHVGSVGDWSGTEEKVRLFGRNKLSDIVEGSTDASILLMTDDANGDALFVDDIYSDLPDFVVEQQARIARIGEIRAGAGDDIVDMTSQCFEYTGDGLTIRGGDGDDTIWANRGDNFLFGDAGNDRIVGASGNDVIAGGIGSDSMHGGGGDDVFTFCDNWGTDTVEQLETGTVTLWFASGSEAYWDAETLTCTDGANSVTVSGVAADRITIIFGAGGSDDADRFAALSGAGAFDEFTSRRVFEESGQGLLSSQ